MNSSSKVRAKSGPDGAAKTTPVGAASNQGATPRKAATREAKLEQPHNVFTDPMRVVTDPELSRRDKLAALSSLEQDARQLATAAAEGMDGGETTTLRPVLEAKRTLEEATPEPASAEAAFKIVLKALEAGSRDAAAAGTRTLIRQAIDAINAAQGAMARDAGASGALRGTPAAGASGVTAAGSTPAAKSQSRVEGAPAPGSARELEEELAKEKLDP